MKKIFFILALVCAVVNVYAQSDSKLTWKAGFGLSTLVGSDADGADNAFSYKVGVGYEFSLSESFAIEPGLMFTNKAFKIDGISGTINRFCVEVPVLAAYKIALNDNMNLIVNAGPYVAYGLFGSDIEFYGDGTTSSVNVYDDGEFDRFEAGAQVGVQVTFGDINVGAEYSRAFTKCDSDYKQYTQGFGITCGYRF